MHARLISRRPRLCFSLQHSISGGSGFATRDRLYWNGPRLVSLGEIRLKTALGEKRTEAGELAAPRFFDFTVTLLAALLFSDSDHAGLECGAICGSAKLDPINRLARLMDDDAALLSPGSKHPFAHFITEGCQSAENGSSLFLIIFTSIFLSNPGTGSFGERLRFFG